MSLSKSVWLPPCHSENGGVTGYGIALDVTEVCDPEDLKLSLAVCKRADCGIEAPIRSGDYAFDVDLGTAFCAEALANNCKFNPKNGI